MLEHADRASDVTDASDLRSPHWTRSSPGSAALLRPAYGRHAIVHRRARRVEPGPDVDTVRALYRLTRCEVSPSSPPRTGSPPRRSLWPSTRLTQPARPVRPRLVPGLRRAVPRSSRLPPRGRAAGRAGRHTAVLANSLINLSWSLGLTDPAPRRDRPAAAAHARQVGDRDILAYASGMWSSAAQLGDWDAAEDELTHAADADGLGDYEHLTATGPARGNARRAVTAMTCWPHCQTCGPAKTPKTRSLTAWWKPSPR